MDGIQIMSLLKLCFIGTLPKPTCNLNQVFLHPVTCVLNLTLHWQPVSFEANTVSYLIKESGSLIHTTTLSNIDFIFSTVYTPLSFLNVTLSAQTILEESVDICYAGIFTGT